MNSQEIEENENLWGRNIAGRLSESATALPHDISERLKSARAQALAKRKIVSLQTAAATQTNGGNGVAILGMGGGRNRKLMHRLLAFLPLFALIAGVCAIAAAVEEDRASEVADIDAELLTDALPPDAYSDPGFAQFLRADRQY